MYANGGATLGRGMGVDSAAMQKELADLANANRLGTPRPPTLADGALASFGELVACVERTHQACARALEDAQMRKAAAEDEINHVSQLLRTAETFLKTLREGP